CINIAFDEKGTQDLKEITGNPRYPYIAVVVANRLLAVAESQQQKVRTGTLRIMLDNYSKEEMQEMMDEANKKR
ncbi:MAG TPA: hypothetical protein VKQ52_00200, partial [Puia sp.]|nr:hypothetical protein [Puia sp.]